MIAGSDIARFSLFGIYCSMFTMHGVKIRRCETTHIGINPLKL